MSRKNRILELDVEIHRLAEPYSTEIEFMHNIPSLSNEPLTNI